MFISQQNSIGYYKQQLYSHVIVVVLNLLFIVDIPCCPGICSEVEDGAPMIILELMEFGDLKNFLIDHKYDIAC